MRRRLSLAVLIAAVPVLAAGSARAAEGMPQLDFSSPLMLAQLVWLVIIFALLYVLLSKWALPKVETVLAHRAATIGADLDAARAAKAEADAAVAEQMTATRAAQAQAQAQLAAAVAEAKSRAAAHAAEVNARLDAQLAGAERRIRESRNAALGGLREVAVDTAIAVVARLTGSTPDRTLVDHEVFAAMNGGTR